MEKPKCEYCGKYALRANLDGSYVCKVCDQITECKPKAKK